MTIFPSRNDFDAFLRRPNGGMEVEIIYAAVELWFAGVIMASAQSIANLTTLEDLFWSVPHRWLAAPWLASSLFTIIGLWLYWQGNKWCATLRSVGAFISAWIWFVMLLRGVHATDGLLPTLGFYFFGAVWQPRIMLTAWYRQRALWAHG